MNRGVHTSEFWLALLGIAVITALGFRGQLNGVNALSIASISGIFTFARAALKARNTGQ